ncbi:MAG TPA: FHA domain-containing protein [Kofleriaceae bacterium]
MAGAEPTKSDPTGEVVELEPLTAIGIHGDDVLFDLDEKINLFRLGRATDADLQVDSDYVSRHHAQLTRIPGSSRLRVVNLSKKTGIRFHGTWESDFSLGAGESFQIGLLRFWAMTAAMQRARECFELVLGDRSKEKVDDATIAARHGEHIVLIGEAGFEQETFASMVHMASLRRRKEFVTLSGKTLAGPIDARVIERAQNGTAFLSTSLKHALAADWIDALLGANVRLVVAAHTLRKAIENVTPDVVNRSHHVEISPLRERAAEIASCVDRMLKKRAASVSFGDLLPVVQDKLITHNWPENLRELRETVDIIATMARRSGGRADERETGIPRGRVERWLVRMKLDLPLVADGVE